MFKCLFSFCKHSFHFTLSHPIPWILGHFKEFSLWRTRFHLVIVFPPRRLRKAHENTLNTSTSLKSKYRSTIIDKVELDITTSSHELPFLLLLRVWVILVLFDNWPIRLAYRVEALLTEFEYSIGITIVLIVKENTPKPTCLIAMRDEKVSISPRLEFLIILRIMLITHILVRSMKLLHILLIHIRRRNISPPPKPPNPPIRLKIPIIKMHRRRKRILRMHHTTQPTRKKRHPLPRRHSRRTIHTPFRRRLQRFRWHRAVHHT
mmetsp:Transcript_4540/g.5250  ORF Transcript_4540/g.5250 Transcript_4540/m.5250 type:complete len:263 (-) Transcript_4540:587-1375(-)